MSKPPRIIKPIDADFKDVAKSLVVKPDTKKAMSESKVVLYQTLNGNVSVSVLFSDETFWMTQKGISKLFNVEVATVNEHLSNIYKSEELKENSTIRKFLIVQTEGGRNVERELQFYNLDTIIAVGYRVNSKQATQFRIWATNTLKEYIVKGFVLNDDMLKNGRPFGKDYFRELLERVRSIRASERRIWQKITDIFAECSTDYVYDINTTSNFYAMMQNKFHFAITGKTAPEIVYDSADSKKEKMGLYSHKNSPDGRVLKSDVTTAKNYLKEDEIKKLERTVSSYFDYIESLIERERTFTMEEFAQSVNKFLSFSEYKVLEGSGKRTRKEADEKAIAEYEIFNKTQKIESDFDRTVKKILKK